MPQINPSIDVHGSPLEIIENLDVVNESANKDSEEPEVAVTRNEDAQAVDVGVENSSVCQMSETDPVLEISEDFPGVPSHVDPPNRRTLSNIKEPIWMKEYATTKKHSSTRHPMANSLNYDKLKPCYRGYLSKLSDCMELKYLSQSAKDERWIQAGANLCTNFGSPEPVVIRPNSI
ncbi:hypothetical protein KY285_017017 [Solanum tuberosum]|nr:hypothetical protein KY285_017017 [Solanum tuberosum]